MAQIEYTKHARNKFDILKSHGFEISEKQVEETVSIPEREYLQSGGRFIAQKKISEQHVLRVVYRVEGDHKVVITFYPAQKERYED
ncbi:MAG: DUF4258 domain-containing protein [Chloroflexi bacterium]|nr:DUF4258 domain-containing protein [Chloroflexota bacterium]MBI3742056.1 DUF4258 domain-containing protein [Chloroflexota bacterium]